MTIFRGRRGQLTGSLPVWRALISPKIVVLEPCASQGSAAVAACGFLL